VLSALLAAGLAAACAADTPERRVRSVIRKIERAVESRSVSGVRDHVSEAYADAGGNDKSALIALLRMRTLRHDVIHLLVQVRSLEFPEAGRAQATVLVAMAGRDIDSLTALAGIAADFYRFDATFADEGGDWRVVRAAWRPAGRDDFVP
jgi:hypothetical protein